VESREREGKEREEEKRRRRREERRGDEEVSESNVTSLIKVGLF